MHHKEMAYSKNIMRVPWHEAAVSARNVPAREGTLTEKASLIGYSRLIKKLRKKGTVADKDKEKISICVERISEIANRLNTLAF